MGLIIELPHPSVQWVPALFPGGVKRPGRGVDHPPPSSAEVTSTHPVGLRGLF